MFTELGYILYNLVKMPSKTLKKLEANKEEKSGANRELQDLQF